MNKAKIIGVLFLTFIIHTIIFADTVYLKNGGVLNGKIVGQSRTNVRLKTDAETKVIPKDTIKRLRFGEVEDPDKKRKEELQRQAEEKRKQAEEEKLRLAEEARLKRQESNTKTEDARSSKDQKIREYHEAKERRAQENARIRAAEIANGPYLSTALIKSVVLPGWGQYYQGRELASFGIGGTFFAGVAGSVYLADRYRKDTEVYNQNIDNFLFTSPLFLSFLGMSISDTSEFILSGVIQSQSIFASRQNRANSAKYANAMQGVVGVIYFWNLLDVVLYHPDKNQSLNMRSKSDGIDLSFNLNF